ncbi:hypothetical protein BZG36_00775 [Bifiguratus adelaidae]|uniref:VOC domain-containing protein n=1 Tax=Bifiguratus adelaidae TaxID=1938954 RepID=A0A261Y6Q0_9FUNG|nr:hypothetical protein BZG36_00775 [Bifiguratus adelaidae]
MVQLSYERAEDLYDSIRQRSLKGECLLFVSADVDSLCACRILQTLLKADFVAHKIVPLSSYADLDDADSSLIRGNDQLRCIIFLGCGGMLDLMETLSLQEDVMVYVIDSRRPLHLHNIFGTAQVIVLDDGHIEADLSEVKTAFRGIEFASDTESEEEEVLEDEGSEDDTHGEDNEDVITPDGKRRSGEHERAEKRQKVASGMSAKSKRDRRREFRHVIAEYYVSGTWFGTSVALQCYMIANELARTTNDLLWLAIVGLTSQFIDESIDSEKYTTHLQMLYDEVRRFNIEPNQTSSRSQSSTFLSFPSSTNDESDIPSTSSNNIVIRFEDEYRFMLFRHWSLYDSMFHSDYVVSKLGIWKERGKRSLMNMLAKMGFSLHECQQIYVYMDVELKKILRQKLESVAPQYGLDNIIYRSFVRQHGYKCSISASDAVYGLSALLSAAPEACNRLGVTIKWNPIGNSRVASDDASQVPKWWLKNFYTAFDALDNLPLLQSGLQLCMQLQRAVVRQGIALIDKNSIRTLKSFRFAVINDGPDLPIFVHESMLSKLAMFLLAAYRERGRRNVPFVLAAYRESAQTYLVVGATGTTAIGQVRRNHFGVEFRKTAMKMKADFKNDGFDTAVMEIAKDEFGPFDPKKSLEFYQDVLGMKLITKVDNEKGKFTLYFLGYFDSLPSTEEEKRKLAFSSPGMLELTYNWGSENDPNLRYANGNSDPGRGFGHIAIAVDNIEGACARFEKMGVRFQKKLTDGSMKNIAFILDPDDYWVEFVKCGYAGSNFPEHVFPSVVGRPILRAEERVQTVQLKDIMVGDEAAEVRTSLQMSYPMENGIVVDFENMRHLWNYTFDEKLKIDPRDSKILLTEPPMNPRQKRVETVQIMFEEYGFQGVYIAIQAVLTLYAQGLLTGVVVDSGDGVTHIVPVYEGFAPENLTRRLNIAGRDVTRYLIKLLLLRGYAFNRTADFETVRQIKEKFCYVSYDLELDQKLGTETTVLVENYTLPDGRVIKVGSERFEAPEVMFQPHLVDVESAGVAEMLFNTIQSADVDIRPELYKHIVLSGGSTMYPGLPSRLEKEVKQLYLINVLKGDASRLNNLKIRIEDPPRRKHMVFLGGAVLADIMKDKESWWITKQEWEEKGAQCLNKLGIVNAS